MIYAFVQSENTHERSSETFNRCSFHFVSQGYGTNIRKTDESQGMILIKGGRDTNGNVDKAHDVQEGDWRKAYFAAETLIPSVERAEALKELVPTGSSMAEMALRFILSNHRVSTVIAG